MEESENKPKSLYERICELHERKGYPKPILENKKGMVGTVVIKKKGNNNMKKKGFNQNGYVEPADYISKEARKKFKLGEFAEKDDEDDDIEEMLELDEIESEGE